MLTYFSILSSDRDGVKTQAITKRRQLTIGCSSGLSRSLHSIVHLCTVRHHRVVRHSRNVVGLLEWDSDNDYGTQSTTSISAAAGDDNSQRQKSGLWISRREGSLLLAGFPGCAGGRKDVRPVWPDWHRWQTSVSTSAAGWCSVQQVFQYRLQTIVYDHAYSGAIIFHEV